MDSAIFVSDPTHMLRVLRIADDLGIEAYGSPTPTSPVQADPLRRVQATVHELGALAVYFLSGGAPQVESPAADHVPAARFSREIPTRTSWNSRGPRRYTRPQPSAPRDRRRAQSVAQLVTSAPESRPSRHQTAEDGGERDREAG